MTIDEEFQHDVPNVRLAFVFCSHRADGIIMYLIHESEVLGITFMKWPEWEQLINHLRTERDDRVVPAMLESDVEAFYATGELPPGWMKKQTCCITLLHYAIVRAKVTT